MDDDDDASGAWLHVCVCVCARARACVCVKERETHDIVTFQALLGAHVARVRVCVRRHTLCDMP